MNIAIIDDIPLELERISGILSEFATLNHISVDLKTFCSAEEFLKDYHPLQYTRLPVSFKISG